GTRLLRIVSHGQATPPGEWYDQPDDEWVALLAGGAGLLIEGETEPRALRPGDWLLLPAGRRHRVEWTASGVATIWLALHMRSVEDSA
ncbi:MAG: cupin, partial [Alphaproteobacteria bacterium]|nr:cupin [Alphaproteobacteria bacterium]